MDCTRFDSLLVSWWCPCASCAKAFLNCRGLIRYPRRHFRSLYVLASFALFRACKAVLILPCFVHYQAKRGQLHSSIKTVSGLRMLSSGTFEDSGLVSQAPTNIMSCRTQWMGKCRRRHHFLDHGLSFPTLYVLVRPWTQAF